MMEDFEVNGLGFLLGILIGFSAFFFGVETSTDRHLQTVEQACKHIPACWNKVTAEAERR